MGVPVITYPAHLPVVERREELVDAIRAHQVLVVAGETGSGKSTQLPKLCLEAGRGSAGMVGHTQPRRLAARAVAERVAEELGGEVGGAVGYAVRFTDRVGPDTRIKVMTDGILLAEVQRDRELRAYDTLIIDEAHERSLNIDFLLGHLRQLLPRRPDLHVVITSATIDTARFSQHFGDAPVVEVSGRTYPVEVRYRPFGTDEGDDRDQEQAVCDALVELAAEGPGDVLVFLSGEREIRDTADAVARLQLANTEVLPLYARLSIEEQHRVFAPHDGRRVVLATNVAETSLTVPGIRYVVDPGTARISRYNRRTKVQRLPIEPVSQASANQRAGRCGRLGPGICIRLYSEDDFAARPEFTDPEILRTNLASVILQMAAARLGRIERFPFVDPPDARSISDGVALLRELGALERDRLTPMGRRLARLPIDPRLGRMVLEADRLGCVTEVLAIASGLAIVDPRERPAGKEQDAAELHARFADPDSDFLAYWNLWAYLREKQAGRSSSQFRKLCRAEHLHHLRVREWQDVHGQLRHIARSLGIVPNDVPADPDRVHLALLAGLLSHVGMWDSGRREYEGARNARFTIAPGSALAKKQARWVMAAELVETNRLRARTVARIRPEWAEQAGAHLVKRSYSEPWWDPKRGAAVADERVTLYGLPVVTGRRVTYAKVDAAVARELFVRHALVEGEWETDHGFLAANRARMDEVRALEDRLRRRDLLLEDDDLFDRYDERIPASITSTRNFDRWWKDERRRDPRRLDLAVADLLDPAAGPIDLDGLPDTWHHRGLDLALSYRFDPGSELDGVTVDIPLDVLNQVDGTGFDWQVPAWRAELVAALLRSLPKAVRRSFVPVPDYVQAFLDRAGPGDGPLLDALERELPRMTGDPIPPGSWRLDEVAPHLRMTFRVVDRHGRPIAWSKDLAALKARMASRLQAAIAELAADVERSGLRRWEVGDLPRVVQVDREGQTVTGHPALVDEGDSVGVRVLATPAEQRRAMWAGTRRLLLLAGPSASKVGRLLPNDVRLALATLPGASAGEVLEDCRTAAVDALLAEAGGPAWDEAGFERLAGFAVASLPARAAEVATTVAGILTAAADARRRLDRLVAAPLATSVADLRSHLDRLVHPGFVTDAGAERLPDVARYVRAAAFRIDKLAQDPVRDRRLLATVHALEDDYAAVAHRDADGEVRWLLEELRVSLFAQSVGTRTRVSEATVRRTIANVG